jgi:hypothetical protein
MKRIRKKPASSGLLSILGTKELPLDSHILAPEAPCLVAIHPHIYINLFFPALVHFVQYKEFAI